ncbi:hypothetical protein BMS3Bbin10_01109 [bacterium BMS3Bbin10]|nr:hypothetical protein BMS3Bbin10_01109 [bacterium BMS3Bbin10]
MLKQITGKSRGHKDNQGKRQCPQNDDAKPPEVFNQRAAICRDLVRFREEDLENRRQIGPHILGKDNQDQKGADHDKPACDLLTLGHVTLFVGVVELLLRRLFCFFMLFRLVGHDAPLILSDYAR